jgi:hypothetical protein
MPSFSYPKLMFLLNEPLDEEMAFAFLGTETGGVDFGAAVLKPHPKLKAILSAIENSNDDKVKNVITEYFTDFYEKNERLLTKLLADAQNKWEESSAKFFKEVALIFGNHNFPVGDYEAYISIINCNPRFLSNKTFQFYYEHIAGPVYIACHELLHFVFYDYVFNNLPQYKDMDPDNSQLWDVAEIFNSVILHTKEFEGIHRHKTVVCYPVHEKYLKYLKGEWDKDKNLNTFIDKIFKEIHAQAE